MEREMETLRLPDYVATYTAGRDGIVVRSLMMDNWMFSEYDLRKEMPRIIQSDLGEKRPVYISVNADIRVR